MSNEARTALDALRHHAQVLKLSFDDKPPMRFDVVQEGSLRRLSHAMDVDDTIREGKIRRAKAEAWDEAIQLAVETLRVHQDGDQFGGPVTVKDMAGYIPTAINPYRREPTL